MKTKKEVWYNDNMKDNKILFAISSDSLIIMDSPTSLRCNVIDGVNNSGLLIETSIDEFNVIYTECLKARKNNDVAIFNFDGNLFGFY